MTSNTQPTGMTAFTVVWLGQLVSLVGTGMTRFALAFWAWQVTGEATALALVGFFSFGPTVLISPLAGALVDRWNRKLVMMFSDLAAGLSSAAILLLLLSNQLQIWHLYVAGAFAGIFESFQFPAYSAAITTMLPKEQYGRANGMLALAQSASGIVAPVFAAGLLIAIGIEGILIVDVITFVAAIGALIAVSVPQPTRSEAGRRAQGSLLKESAYGFRYIFERPSLLGLQLVFFGSNLIATFGFVLLAPMILARTRNDAGALASVESALGIGGVIGGLLMSTWGGPKRRVHGVLAGMALESVLGTLLIGLGAGTIVWVAGAFLSSLFIPIINGSNQAIWQAKVAPDVQGRVFATRRLIAQITAPVAMLLAGPLADRVLEPAMMPGGSLAPIFGGLVGAGSGAGMALMFVITGILGMFAGLAGYAFRAVRNAEDILPDHDAEVVVSQMPEAAAVEAQA